MRTHKSTVIIKVTQVRGVRVQCGTGLRRQYNTGESKGRRTERKKGEDNKKTRKGEKVEDSEEKSRIEKTVQK